MGNLQARGAAWNARQLRAHASSIVTYRRGGASVAVPAVRGKTEALVADAQGGSVASAIDNWLILAADLVLGGSRILPEVDDLIVHDTNGTPVTYRVMNAPGEGTCFRWSDTQGIRYRINVIRT